MKIKTYRSLGFNVNISVPSTVEENDALAKRPDATLNDAVDNVVYRGGTGLPTFREELAFGIEAATGIKRLTEELKDKEGKTKTEEDGTPKFKYIESEGEYLDRVIATTGRTQESFQDIADAAAAKMKYDPSAPERTAAGPKNPPKAIFEQVDALIAAGQGEAVASSLATILGREVKGDRESLAKAIHEDQLNEIRKAKAKFSVAK